MKKSYKNLIILGAAATLFAFAGSAQAAVKGVCSNCHTMHNSQNGAALSGTTNAALTTSSCLGCHTQNSTAGKLNDAGYPAVIVTALTAPSDYDTDTLPGGFIITDTGTFTDASNTIINYDATRHNVAQVNNADALIYANIGYDPPGYDTTLGGSIDLPSGTWDSQLTCAGSFGCHGD
ncbi:MAG: hypothetical protein KAI90_00960, partial [Desulfobulbaceae bacterium]|nr:hypothetical protein [Desulfobulbaceae bacterium]